MNKKAIVGDATIVAISLIIIAILGIASFFMFGLDIFGESVEQIVKDFEYKEIMDDFLYDFLKQDANYKKVSNLDLISLYTQGKEDFDVVNNKLSENFGIEECWFLQIHREGKKVIRFVKNGCTIKTEKIDLNKIVAKKIVGLENLELRFGII